MKDYAGMCGPVPLPENITPDWRLSMDDPSHSMARIWVRLARGSLFMPISI